MFKFGFDLPEEGEPSAPTSGPAAAPATSPAAASAPAAATAAPAEAEEGGGAGDGPVLTVLDLRAAVRRAFDSQLMYEMVELGVGGDGAGGGGEGEGRRPSSAPLRRVYLEEADETLKKSLKSERRKKDGDGSDSDSDSDSDDDREATDLIPGVYEGGLKVWECSLDLCRHLAGEMERLGEGSGGADVAGALSGRGKTLELGCGHGLPGCLVLRELRRKWGAEPVGGEVEDTPPARDDGYSVLFSDYNEFVLRDVTVPSIILNMESEQALPDSSEEYLRMERHVGCVAGDWFDLSDRLARGGGGLDAAAGGPAPSDDGGVYLPPDGRFDLVLAAEVTYTEASGLDAARLLGRHLKVDAGVGLVATKRYYFGVGGGTDAFRQAAAEMTVRAPAPVDGDGDGDVPEELECRFVVETVRSYDSGVGNIRDLLRVRLVAA